VAFLLLLLPNLIDLILDLQSPPTYVTEFMRLYTSEDAQHPISSGATELFSKTRRTAFSFHNSQRCDLSPKVKLQLISGQS
jgi:hypothetical protein